MKTYDLDVSWTMTGTMKVEANSYEEAVNKALEADLPDGEYLGDSFVVHGEVDNDA